MMKDLFLKEILAQQTITQTQTQTITTTITTTIQGIFDRVVEVLRLVGFALAIVIAIFAGILYITSIDSNRVKTAHKTLIWLLVGIALILVGSYVVDLVRFILNR